MPMVFGNDSMLPLPYYQVTKIIRNFYLNPIFFLVNLNPIF